MIPEKEIPYVMNEHAFKEAQSFFSKQKPRGLCLGKKKVLSEGAISEMVYPAQGEVLGVVVKLLGFDRILVKCQDGKERLCRIRGKMKRRVWIRESDIVIVSPWDFQSDKRGDVVWRYTHAQADTLRRKGILTI
jgi:translation initiation factor 1A